MFKRILVALDGSKASENALYTAIQEARLRNAELNAVYVVQHLFTHQMVIDSPVGAPETNPEMMDEILSAEAQRVLLHAKEISHDEGVDIIIHIKHGDPREEIPAFSDEIHADLVILGIRGKSSLERLLLGSVSSAVIMNSKITTLLVKGK